MAKKKGPAIKFEEGSKMPIIFYAITAVVLSCFFMIVTLLTSGFSFTLSKELPAGDVNGDGKINSVDALQVILHENDKIRFNGAQIDAADINKDGEINDLDALLIEQYSNKCTNKLGELAPVNVSIENPNAKKNVSSVDTTVTENGVLKSGNSYASTFSTSESGIYTSATVTNKWQADNKYMYQIEITVTNNSDTYMGDTSLDIGFSGKNTEIEKTWDCYEDNADFGTKIKTNSKTYTAPGGSIKCGMIISCSSPSEVKSIAEAKKEIQTYYY